MIAYRMEMAITLNNMSDADFTLEVGGRLDTRSIYKPLHTPKKWQIRFVDKQIMKLQETPYKIPDGGTPHMVNVLMHGKPVYSGKPGDRVEEVGQNKLKHGNQLLWLFMTRVEFSFVNSNMLEEFQITVINQMDKHRFLATREFHHKNNTMIVSMNIHLHGD